ncbi:MAG: hypothetical protein Tsb009_32220 [Planctomycetaceae bacterium]
MFGRFLAFAANVNFIGNETIRINESRKPTRESFMVQASNCKKEERIFSKFTVPYCSGFVETETKTGLPVAMSSRLG